MYKNTQLHKIALSCHNSSILLKLTRQKPVERFAKDAIAPFSVKSGDSVGFFVTLRRKRMASFFERFKYVNIPSNRRFQRFNQKSLSQSVTVGFKDCRDFLETANTDEKIGFQINFYFKSPIHFNDLLLKQ